MKKTIEQLIVGVLGEIGLEPADFVVEHPSDISHGDYSTNIAMVLFKGRKAFEKAVEGDKNTVWVKFGAKFTTPKELAEEVVKHLETKKNGDIEKIEVAGAGFINFYLTKEFFKNSLAEIIEKESEFGKNESLKGEKTMVEYTDPNPFKEFHIGHLMSNAIGETLSRIIEWNGAEMRRVCYQGDVGIHVAKAVWGMLRDEKDPYAAGSKAYEESEEWKKEIQEYNKQIYEKSSPEINRVYDLGKRSSLMYFDAIYKKLGTKFDHFFFESETGERGKKIVEENKDKVFEIGENGAVVFHAEKHNPKLHTRVFINSEGLPTYEAKELGLAPTKHEKYPYDRSIVITGNEVNEYFKVVLEAMKQTFPDLAEKTEHLSHGMLRLPTGKMSSRTGDVITAESLIEEVKNSIKEKGNEPTDDIAVGAIKYMILRQGIGNDIIFDFEKSISTEGDSGVYLQYAYARTNSLLEKADKDADTGGAREQIHQIEKLLYRFPEVVERAREEYAPNHITTYLTELASSYNNFYAHEQVISDDPESPYRLAITKAFNVVMKNGLEILGIPAPERI